MSLRRKMLIIIGLTLTSLALITGIAAHYILLAGFANLEKAEVKRGLNRAVDAIVNDLATLDALAGDYAGSDDTYAFARNRNQGYLESNLTPKTLAKHGLHVILLAEATGRILYAIGIDPRTGKETGIPQSVLKVLSADESLLSHRSVNSSRTGILSLPEGPMLLASRPILTSYYQGPIRGSLLMGRYLDALELRRLSELVHLTMAVRSTGRTEADRLARSRPVVIEPLGKEEIAGRMILRDIFGRPALVLSVTLGRDIYRQGRISFIWLVVWLLITGGVLMIVVMVFTEKLLLARLGALSASVERIGHAANLDARVAIGGGDELATLAGAINDMLESLNESQVELEESEERSRMLVEELRGEHQQLLQIIEFLPDPTFVIDREGKVIAWNQAIEELTGVKKQDILGKGDYVYAVPFYGEPRPTLIDLVGKEDRETESQYERVVRKAGTICAEVLIPGSSGGQVYLWLAASPLHDSKGSLMGAIESIRDITERKQVEERLKYLSLHDPLTGLYNRTYFEQEMHRIEETNRGPVGLILCDIDGLKLINDTLGHEAGDRLLLAAAGVIQQPFQGEATVARIGGDEFAILVADYDQAQVDAKCHQVREGIVAHNAANPELPLSVSLGSASGSPQARRLNELFREADNRVYREKLHRIRSARSAIVAALMKALEARDFMTGDHAERLQDLCESLATAVGLTERRLDDLRLFAQFHDIGKVSIPDRILFKSGVLTSEEDQEMQRHSEIGFRIAQSAPDLARIADWILKHHEWWNGRGYPFGLKGEEIPLECRILAIAGAYDAMISNRPYRKALAREQALDELRKSAGEQFDPDLVAKFLKVLADRKADGEGAGVS